MKRTSEWILRETRTSRIGAWRVVKAEVKSRRLKYCESHCLKSVAGTPPTGTETVLELSPAKLSNCRPNGMSKISQCHVDRRTASSKCVEVRIGGIVVAVHSNPTINFVVELFTTQ